MATADEHLSDWIIRGFSVLFTKCLQVHHSDSILVVHDEAFQKFLKPLIRFLIDQHLQATFVLLPKAYQRALVEWGAGLGNEIELPRGVASAIGESSIILNCLDSDLDTASVRAAILKRFRPQECRFAHIPGLSMEILSVLTSSPIDDILASAETVAWALGEAETADLFTEDSCGNQFRLSMRLDCWENEPLMSPGLIYPNSWGNIPPGEVFCCPDPETVNGSVCINGSIPGIPLAEEDATVVEFDHGKLVRWSPLNSVVGQFLLRQQDVAANRGDSNWNTFAELGIGLNPEVNVLTGNALLDEKALGTVHVAIGNNRSFGHRVMSHIHADMVIRRPTLLLDSVVLYDAGSLRLGDFELARRSAQISPIDLNSHSRFLFKLAKLSFSEGRPLRRLFSAGRIGLVPIVELVDDLWLADVMRDVQGDASVSYAELKTCSPKDRLDHALATLYHYGILTIEASHGKNSTSDNQIGTGRSRLLKCRA